MKSALYTIAILAFFCLTSSTTNAYNIVDLANEMMKSENLPSLDNWDMMLPISTHKGEKTDRYEIQDEPNMYNAGYSLIAGENSYVAAGYVGVRPSGRENIVSYIFTFENSSVVDPFPLTKVNCVSRWSDGRDLYGADTEAEIVSTEDNPYFMLAFRKEGTIPTSSGELLILCKFNTIHDFSSDITIDTITLVANESQELSQKPSQKLSHIQNISSLNLLNTHSLSNYVAPTPLQYPSKPTQSIFYRGPSSDIIFQKFSNSFSTNVFSTTLPNSFSDVEKDLVINFKDLNAEGTDGFYFAFPNGFAISHKPIDNVLPCVITETMKGQVGPKVAVDAKFVFVNDFQGEHGTYYFGPKFLFKSVENLPIQLTPTSTLEIVCKDISIFAKRSRAEITQEVEKVTFLASTILDGDAIIENSGTFYCVTKYCTIDSKLFNNIKDLIITIIVCVAIFLSIFAIICYCCCRQKHRNHNEYTNISTINTTPQNYDTY